MYSFLRKIRKAEIFNNRYTSYVIYASGEIFLIVIGIILAMELQEWDEERKHNDQFRASLDQIYSSLTDDILFYEKSLSAIPGRISLIDSVIEMPEVFPKEYLPHLIYTVGHNFLEYFNSNTTYHADHLKFNPRDKSQNEIAKHIADYVSQISVPYSSLNIHWTLDINLFAMQNDIAFPRFNNDKSENGFDLNPSRYDKEDFLRSLELIQSKSFKTKLRTLQGLYVIDESEIRRRKSNGQSILGLIKGYYPEVKVVYSNVGIIGTSIDGYDDVGAISTPMKLTDIDKDIWEIDIYLKKGSVKFRCRDSWSVNWGGNSFPKGVGERNGDNIEIVQPGNYHIVFKPIQAEYEFVHSD